MLRNLPSSMMIDVTTWKFDAVAGGVRFTYANGHDSHLWHMHGFEESNDHVADVLGWYGLRLSVSGVPAGTELAVTLTCSLNRNPRPEALIDVTAPVVVRDGEISLPLDAFPLDEGMGLLFHAVVAVTVRIPSQNQKLEGFAVLSLQFVVARDLAIGCALRGKPIDRGEEATYATSLVNLGDDVLPVTVRVRRKGTEVLPVALRDSSNGEVVDHSLSRPAVIVLKPGERREVGIVVSDHPRLGTDGHEEQHVVFATDLGEYELKLVTVRASYDYHTTIHRRDIDEIREKIATHAWAKTAWRHRVAEADAWQVPHIDPKANHLFDTLDGERAFNCSLVYCISGDDSYARKVADFLRELIDPGHGYFVLPKAGHQELVHEGEFFRNAACAFDHILDAGLLSDHEIAQVRRAFRGFEEIIRRECLKGKISNWSLAELAGAVAIAAEREDLEAVEEFLDIPGGVLDHIARGILNDGWWYEASVGYNFLAIGLFLLMSDMIDRYGYDIAHREVPASFAGYYAIDERYVDDSDKIDGLSTEIWGDTDHPTRSVRMLVDSMTAFFDYEGLICGINDSMETRVPAHASPVNPRYDLAYRIYRDKSLLPLLHTVPDEDRDLYYGVADLPDVDDETPILSNGSATAPVAGVTILRSQTPGRSPREQYQVTVKTGILGGAHGHYDRLALNSMRRFGKSFTNPEMIWYSYHTFMYKFYVQNSVTHNMTTVDLKQQDPSEPKELLFSSDESLQASVFEVRSRWCNPPYGGWVVTPGASYAEQAWLEGRKVPLPAQGDPVPDYAKRSAFTEPVLQRRATLVTDDYVVVLDYLEGESEHQYDCLFHADGLRSLTVGGRDESRDSRFLNEDPEDSDHIAVDSALNYLGHDRSLDPSPLSSGQFITDCHRFGVAGQERRAVKASFCADMAALNDLGWFVKQRTTGNEPGLMHLDIWSVLAQGDQHDQSDREIVVGCDPEYYQTQQQLRYRVLADGADSASGSFGAWIFGRDDLDVALDPKTSSLTLETFSGPYAWKDGMIEPKPFNPAPALFWTDGYIETRDGQRISLNDLRRSERNVLPTPAENRDYQGGPVTIDGRRAATSLPASPGDIEQPAVITLDIAGLDAVKLHVSIGADNPIGPEQARRRTLDFRTHGRTARFVTVLEQHDGTPQVRDVRCDDDGRAVVVSLANGREQRIIVADPTLADPSFELVKQ